VASQQPSTYWDAETYDRLNVPHRRWASAIIDDLELRGDETVLDAGCGSGSVTFMLLERLPRGRIYALDFSPEMIAKITDSISERGLSGVTPMHGDLTNFTLPEPVDLVFSNAVLHWIHDDDGLFGSLLGATKPGGWLRAQCGGGGIFARLNGAVAAVRQRPPFDGHLEATRDTKNYRTPEIARAAMERAGWGEVRASTHEAPVAFEDHEEAALYLRTIILRDHVANLPAELQEPYLHAVIDEYVRRFGEPFTADYVRLDLWATRPLRAS
jgi:trans-aconitate 2-methyltransferase